MQFDLIVFDWDGTLMDSTAHIVRSIQRASADLKLPMPTREAASHVIGLSLGKALRTACPGLSPERYHDLEDAYRHHYLCGEETVELFDGVHQGLSSLKEAGVLLAVATGKSRKGLDRALEVSGLAGFFDATRTVDECNSKPDPQMLLDITDRLGVEMQRTLMVGDTSHDLLMAVNAKAHGAGVSYGAHPLEVLEDCRPAAIFHDFPSLQHWLMPRLG
ncbi:HAD-IA family hydrolase [Craterilacuibacter sp.]|uniref:HAD-IA family hydrolase n=1 Tax=Craterilacuibacter sp. TaxID=2870909 RepID=UPI003F2C85CE